MNQQQLEIREQQQASWNKFSSGWKKWDEINMTFIAPAGKEIIAALHPQGQQQILDIASGTGEPALTIASMIKEGHVTLTDISGDMLAIAQENAAKRHLTNITIKQCDVCELPFADESFDGISCRFGFMFFPDIALATSEMARVLKKGGRIATTVWNVPDKNFWVTVTMGTIHENMDIPAPPPGAPGMFRCAPPHLMENIFEQAGLKNIQVKEITLKMNSGTAETYWNMMTEVGAPIVAALSKADDPLREKIKNEVFEKIKKRYPDPPLALDASALIITGEK